MLRRYGIVAFGMKPRRNLSTWPFTPYLLGFKIRTRSFFTGVAYNIPFWAGKKRKGLPSRRQHNHPPPGNLAAAFRAETVLFDQQMLQPPDMRVLRRQFDGLSERHHAIDRLLGFVQRLVLFRALILETERLLKKEFHLADGVAAKDRNLQSVLFEILQRPWWRFSWAFSVSTTSASFGLRAMVAGT